MPNKFGTPEHWLARAQEARTMADGMNDPEAIREMLKIAESYERIAKRAEAKEAGVNMAPSRGLTRDA